MMVKKKYVRWIMGILLSGVVFFAFLPSPSVLQTDATEETMKVSFNSAFVLHFSHPMNKKSVEAAFQISPKISGHFRWPDRKTMEFYPDEPLTIDDQYRLTIKGKAKSLWLKSLNFDTVLPYLVTGPPYVLFVDPSENGVLRNQDAITVLFDRPMNWDAVNEGELLEISPSLQGRIRFLGMSAFQFIPEHVKLDEHYQIIIPKGLKAIDGGITEASFSRNLKGPSLQVNKSFPAMDNTEKLDLSDPIKVYFNDEAPLEGVKPGINALLYPSNDLDAINKKRDDGFFNTEVTYDTDERGQPLKNVLVFKPGFPYQPGETYRFILKSDSDLRLDKTLELSFKTTDPLDPPDTSGKQKITWLKEGMEFFVPGDDPILELTEPPAEEAILSLCQISSNDFMSISAKKGWDDHRCDSDEIKIKKDDLKNASLINLKQYFNSIDWNVGMYFVSLTVNGEKLTKLFMVQDAALLLKRSDEDLFVWALDTVSGAPIADMTIEILNYDGEAIAEGKTDESGVYHHNEQLQAGLYVRGKKEKGESKFQWGFVSDQWSFGMAENDGFSENSGLHIRLNQTSFMPGEVIKIKGIWRTKKDHLLSLPTIPEIQAGVADAQNNTLLSRIFVIRRDGSFDGELRLPDTIRPGYYSVVLSDMNQHSIQKPLPIEIKSKTAHLALEWSKGEKNYVADSTPVFIVKARYENGFPAANVKGTYTLFQSNKDFYFQEGSILYRFGRFLESNKQNRNIQKLIKKEMLTFDMNGEATLLLTDEKEDFLPAGYEYSLNVEAGSESDLPATTIARSFKVNEGLFDVGVGIRHAIIEEDEAIEGSLVAMNHKREFLEGKTVKISLLNDTGGKSYYSKNVSTQSASTSFSIPINKIKDGVYVIRAESQDNKGGKIIAEEQVIIVREKGNKLNSDLFIVADQTNYPVGGRARFLIHEPLASTSNPVSIMLTCERGGILFSQGIVMNSPVATIHVPIKDFMAPYFIANVTRFKAGGNFSFEAASKKIEVENDKHEIVIDFSYEPKNPVPGEPVKLKFLTRDNKKNPVSSALSLNIVDENNEMMTDSDFSYKEFFLGNRITETSNSNTDILNDFQPNSEKSGMKADSRTHSYYFNPTLITNTQGEAEITFLLPKETGHLRLNALATRNADQFGMLSESLKMNKKLLITPILPDFVEPGDQTVFSAFIKNISEETLQSSLVFNSPNAGTKGDRVRNFVLQPGEATEVSFNVLINSREVKDSIQIRFESGEDVVERFVPTFQLKAFASLMDTGLLKEDIWSGRLYPSQYSKMKLERLELNISGSPVALAQDRSKNLEALPYQSTYLVAARLLSELSMLPDNPAENKVLLLQNFLSQLSEKKDEGRYRFFSELLPDPRLSALVLLAYKQAKNHGFEIDNSEVSQTLEYLLKSLDTEYADDEKTFILWVLGIYNQFDTERALSYFQQRENLSLKAKAFLLMNLHDLGMAGQKSIYPVHDRLQSEIADEGVEEDGSLSFDDSKKTTAMLLFALSQSDPENPMLEKMMHFLAKNNHHNANHPDPEELLWTILALGAYRDQKEADIRLIAQVKINGVTLLDQSIGGDDVTKNFSRFLDSKFLKTGGVNDLLIKRSGIGPLYMSAYVNGFVDPMTITPQEDGLLLVRKLYEVNEEGTKLPVKTFKKGGFYLSELEFIVPTAYQDVVLIDPIPSSLRTITSSHSVFSMSHSKEGGNVYYASRLPAGVYKITTELQAILPGDFTYWPASLFPMFESSVMSVTKTEKIQIID